MSKVLWIVIVIILAAAGVWAYVSYNGMTGGQYGQNVPAYPPQAAVAPDESAQIDQDISSIQIDGLDAELKSIEKEVVQ